MCGRFTLRTSRKGLVESFDLLNADMADMADMPELRLRYNIAPTQQVAAIRVRENGRRQLVLLKWGLIPSWADDPAIGNRMINARGETVATKPSFRSAFKSRRCLIVADGFYEWQKRGAAKQPYLTGLESGKPFAFAGLWEHWHHEDQTIESCTIITTTANELMEPLHDRMPVILPPSRYDHWIDPKADRSDLEKMLQPYPADEMSAFPVSTVVNNPRNDKPECVEKIDT